MNLFLDVSSIFLSRQLKNLLSTLPEVFKSHLSWYVKGTPGRDTNGNISLVQGQAYYVTSSLLHLSFLMRKSLCSWVKTVKERNILTADNLAILFLSPLLWWSAAILCYFVLCPCSGFSGWSLDNRTLVFPILWYYCAWCAPPKSPHIGTGVETLRIAWHAISSRAGSWSTGRDEGMPKLFLGFVVGMLTKKSKFLVVDQNFQETFCHPKFWNIVWSLVQHY